MTNLLGDTAEDAERWWRAYQLAESDQAGKLREHAEAGDEHARRQLASWLADRVRTEEAIEVIRPLADAGDEVAELWLARWLARHEHLDELRELIASHREALSSWLARGPGGGMRVVRLVAELGDDAARRQLSRWLSRLRQRATDGDEYARSFLAANPDWRDFRAEWPS
jgi:hypothetical protein